MPSKKDWSTYLISWKTKSDRQCTDPGQHESGVASGQGPFEFLIDNATAASHQAPPAASPDSPWTPSHQFGFSPGGPSTYVPSGRLLAYPMPERDNNWARTIPHSTKKEASPLGFLS